MLYSTEHKKNVHQNILGHLQKQVKKYLLDKKDFRKHYFADLVSQSYGKNLLMVCSIVVSQLLREGINGMDAQGFVEWSALKRAISDAIKTANEMANEPDAKQFFDVLFAVVDSENAFEMCLRHVIFEDLPLDTYENCGRGGRYGTIRDGSGTLFVRARYGHTIASGLDLETVAGMDTTLEFNDALVHGTTMKNFFEIAKDGAIFSGSGLAVMMERMPEELSHFVDYVREGRHDEGRGGLKDPITVAKRHLPDEKKGIVALIETKSVKFLKEHSVRIYTANPPAGMFQVVSGNEVTSKGLRGIGCECFARFHLFRVDGEEREYLESLDSIEEVLKKYQTENTKKFSKS